MTSVDVDLSNMFCTIFTIVLSALHLWYSAWCMLKYCWKYIVRQYKFATRRYSGEEELKSIVESVKRFNKIPAHLAFIIVNENISYNDLAKIITWCVVSRISCLSFYDHTGALKKNEMKLRSALLEKWKDPPVIWGSEQQQDRTLMGNGYSNGILSKASRCLSDWSSLQVLLLSPNEGRHALEAVTQNVCVSVQSGNLDVFNINEAFMDRALRLGSKEKPVTDPELAVWCGKYCCNCGFLPWHIRVTQFLHLRTHHDISLKDFISLLEKYSMCEQRFGK